VTVIVYRDGVMAADTGEFMGGLIAGTGCEKVVRLPDGGLLACAGRKSDIWRFRDWAMDGFRPADRPAPFENFGALVVGPDGKITKYDERSYPYPLEAEWAMEGCEEEFLTGLLVMGATATQAVTIAIERCAYAAGKVFAMRLETTTSSPGTNTPP
jgi:hypothetical protein